MTSPHSNKFSLNVSLRKLTWNQRSKPDFLIIGAQKAGTTSLWQYLNKHPKIVPGLRKEVHFFDGGRRSAVDNYSLGLSWYMAHFPLKKILQPDQLTFEATPSYMFSPDTAQRIYDFNPNTKLIALLRNPVERAISHYFHNQRKKYDSLPILEAFRGEDERLQNIVPSQNHADYRHFSYKRRGLYAKQLAPYLSLFPSVNICLINSTDFFAEPHSTLQTICHFLGISPDLKKINPQPKNVGLNKEKVPDAVYTYLAEYFEKPNKALFKLIGRKFDW